MSSFLDSTGLGTFWSKVKGYLTDNYVKIEDLTAPVIGYTDILTPVNILPNSDFSRSGGYPETITSAALNQGSSINVASGWALYALYGNWINITVTRSASDGITITGTYVDGAGDYKPTLRLNYVNINHKTETLSGFVDFDENVNGLTISYSSSGSKTFILNNPSVDLSGMANSIIIWSIVGVANVGCSLAINEGTSLSVKIRSIGCYEGQFKNPPIYKSLDVLPNNQFALADMSNTSIGSWRNDLDCIGFSKDFTSNTADGVRLNGVNPDSLNVYSKMRRCNLSDAGVVNAYYGDAGYKEDGSNGQVMVEIPAFYYRVIPTKTAMSNTGRGTAILEGEWWISDTCKEGFKLHPLFMNNGQPKAKAYIGAFEGSTYDVSASSYNTTDAQTVDFTNDKLASIANAKPCSGLTQTGATRAGFRKIASNRGTGWHQMDIFGASALQLLMAVEFASFNSQTKIGRGVCDFSDGTGSNTAKTGSTIGNTTGRASSTKVFVDGSETTQTVDGKVSVNYRGVENFWGSIWGWIDGINYHDVVASGRYCYLANPDGSSTYADDTANTYHALKFQLPTGGIHQKYFGYDPDYDFILMPTQLGGTETGPVGDKFYESTGGWRVAYLGGCWSYHSDAGSLFWFLCDASPYRNRSIGGRLAFR